MSETAADSFTNLCIVTAVDIEFKIVADLLTGKSLSDNWEMKILRGFSGARRITVLQSGLGANGFGARLEKYLEDNRHDALVVVGLAGGLDPKLRAGDAILYELCYDAREIEFGRPEQLDPKGSASIASEIALSNFLFEALSKSDLRCIRGSGITASKIITEAKEKLALGESYGAAAVDMESYEALSVCARLDLPAAVLRLISDEAKRGLPDFNRVYDAEGRMNGRLMAAVMIARPVPTFHFLLSVRRALRSMKESLRAVLSA